MFLLPTEKPIAINQLILIKLLSNGFSQDFTLQCESCIFNDEAIIYISKMIHGLCSEGHLWNVYF